MRVTGNLLTYNGTKTNEFQNDCFAACGILQVVNNSNKQKLTENHFDLGLFGLVL